MNIIYELYSWLDKILLGIVRVSNGKHPIVRLPFYVKGGKNIRIGNNCFIGKGAKLYSYSDFGRAKISIGNNFIAQTNVTISSCDSITIGDDVLFGSNIMINDNNHLFSPEKGEYGVEAEAVTIGDKTWIAQNVCVLKGVHIGKGCIVGAGSIVTKDIPDYHIAVGNPAVIIKRWDFDNKKWVKIEGA